MSITVSAISQKYCYRWAGCLKHETRSNETAKCSTKLGFFFAKQRYRDVFLHRTVVHLRRKLLQ